MLKCYRFHGKPLYYTFHDESVHFVPNIRWSEYITHRKNVPVECRMYDTIEKAEDEAVEVIEFFRQYPDTPFYTVERRQRPKVWEQLSLF